MELISSDTNVWIDFKTIGRIKLPFLLPYIFIMYEETMESELLVPPGFREEVEKAGLVAVDITEEEFFLAEKWGMQYPKLTTQDRIALAIAKNREITLLTGDKPLRNAAKAEGIKVIGTIKILDELYDSNYIPKEEYKYCLIELQKHNGMEVRLPKNEIIKRIKRLT